MESSVAPAPAKRASLWEDFVDVLYAPARVFERRRGSGFGMPLLIVAILFGVISAATFPLTRPLMERQMAAQVQKMRDQGMSEDQVRQGQALGERIATIGGIVGAPIGICIGVLISALVLWGLTSLFGGKLDFQGAGLVSVYSVVPLLVAGILGAALLAVLDAESLPPLQQMSVGPALLLGRDADPILTAVLARFGLADLWSVFITGVGLSVVARMPRGRAFAVAAASWVVGTLFTVAMAARQAMG